MLRHLPNIAAFLLAFSLSMRFVCASDDAPSNELASVPSFPSVDSTRAYTEIATAHFDTEKPLARFYTEIATTHCDTKKPPARSYTELTTSHCNTANATAHCDTEIATARSGTPITSREAPTRSSTEVAPPRHDTEKAPAYSGTAQASLRRATAQAPGRYVAAQAAGQPGTARAQAGLRLAGASVAPFSRPRRGRPFTLQVNVVNDSDQSLSGLVTARVDAAPDFQAGAETNVPAHETRKVDLRLQLPNTLTGNTFDLSMSLHAVGNPEQVLLSPTGKPLIDTLKLNVDTEALVTALLLDREPRPQPEWAWPQNGFHMTYELTIAARVDIDLSRRTLSVGNDNLPSQLIDWDGIDAVAIGDERAFHDTAATTSLSRWLAAGGRAWVMLDLVDADNLQRLLPDGMSCETIDDIQLNSFVAETDLYAPLSVADRTVQVDEPLHMRRVTQVGGEVTHRIDGYPVAIWFRVGRGRLLVTTLDARGLTRSRSTPHNTNPEFDSNFELQPWARSLADYFYESRDLHSPLEQVEVQYPLKHIGNPVLNRNFVLACVFGFCVALTLSGWVCWQRGAMISLGWLIPSLSIAAAIPLVVAASQLRRDIPNTSAHLQLIEVLPGSQNIQAHQWTATYMSGSEPARLIAKGDATVSWPSSSQQLDLRRLTWLDHQKWQLSSSGWPHGLWRLQSRHTLPPQKLDVIAKVDRAGLSLQLPTGLAQPLEDAVVIYTAGDPAVCGRIDAGQTITVPDRQLTADDSWLGSSIVSDEQGRREEVYRAVPARDSQAAFPTYPALLGWTRLWSGPVSWDVPRDERGSALVVLPIKLLPVPSGTEVTVPHMLVRAETPAEGNVYSTAFSNINGLWRDATTLPGNVPLRFYLPPQVCPLAADEIVCDLQLRAPQRQVVITSLAKDASQPIAKLESPLGALQFRITDPAILRDASDGVINLNIEIGSQTGQESTSLNTQVAMWQIDYFRISLHGHIAERQ